LVGAVQRPALVARALTWGQLHQLANEGLAHTLREEAVDDCATDPLVVVVGEGAVLVQHGDVHQDVRGLLALVAGVLRVGLLHRHIQGLVLVVGVLEEFPRLGVLERLELEVSHLLFFLSWSSSLICMRRHRSAVDASPWRSSRNSPASAPANSVLARSTPK